MTVRYTYVRAEDFSRWKPVNMQDHLTITELANEVDRTRSRILQLERAKVIAKPVMVKIGRSRVRLYSPEEVAKVKAHFQNPERQRYNSGIYRAKGG